MDCAFPVDMKYVIYLQLLGLLSWDVYAALDEEIDYLTENFFANLQENLIGAKTTEIPYDFIDRQVDNYLKLFKKTHGIEKHPARTKRATTNDYNIDRDNYDVFMLAGLTPLNRIDVKNPRDVMLFKHCFNGSEKWYTVSLEHGNEDRLVLHKFNGSDFVRINSQRVNNGIRLGVHTTKNGTYIAAAENSESGEDFLEKSSVYLFTLEEELFVVQKFDVNFASDVSIWEDKGEVFMAVAKQMSNTTGEAEYETKSVIYKWIDGHFDIVQFIDTSEAVKISPFFIGKSHFIVITNRQSNLGISNVHSEILEYDLVTEKFVTYQKILTHGASDIKVFCFTKDDKKEYFLVVANTFSRDSNETVIYNSSSIIYKYVDGYFIPFQNFKLIGVTEWLPVIGRQGEFALFAACKYEGLKIYHYNGWKFVEAQAQYTNGAFGKGIIAMNSYVLNNQPVIVVANSNDDGEMTNFYDLNFKKYNTFNEFYDNLLGWCKESILELKKSKADDVNDVPQSNATQNDDLASKPTSNDQLMTHGNDDGVTESLEPSSDQPTTNTINEDTREKSRKKRSSEEENLNLFQQEINQQIANFNEIETAIKTVMNPLQVTTIPNDIFAENVIVNEETHFETLIAQNINDIDVASFLRNVININHDLNIVELNLRSAEFTKAAIEFINGQNSSDLLHTTDALNLMRLEVSGSVIFDNGVHVDGTVNGYNITRDRILLTNGDQVLTGDLNVRDIKADSVEARFLNKLPLLDRPQVQGSVHISSAETIRAKNLIIGGFINNIDVPTLDKYALKMSGDQVINSTYIFDGLRANNIITSNLNGAQIPEDLVRTDAGKFKIEQAVQLTGGLVSKSLNITRRLNEIGVRLGKLDVLLKDSDGLQKITGHKSFANVHLLSPIKLQGNINRTQLQWMNPFKEIDQELHLIGDYFINGNVTIENSVAVDDVLTSGKEYSLKKLSEDGLRVLEDAVPVHLKFTQQLNVQEIFADKINNQDPHSWIVNGRNETQYIKGWKTFEGDLHITGRTNLVTVNGINVPEMDADIMKIEGNQVVNGKHHIQNMNADSIQGTNIKLGPHSWQDIVTSNRELVFNGNTTLNSLTAIHIDCESVEITGDINNITFNKMVADTVLLGATGKIGGLKHFDNLMVDQLTSKGSVNLRRIPSLIKKGEVTFATSGVFSFPENASIDEIWFNNKLNNFNSVEFSSNWLDDGEERSINGDQYFENLTLLGDNFVVSEHLNNINLIGLSENTVKIDEEHEFGNAEFRSDIISMNSVTLRGHFEGLDIDNIVAYTGEPLVIANKINFLDDVFITGNVYTRGLVNGVNFTSLCSYAEPKADEAPKNLVVNGNALFLRGPLLISINNRSTQEVLDNSWFWNREQALTGNLHFGEVNFEDDVSVKGFVDEVKLELLKNTYFSKSRNQTITARMEFLDIIKFGGDLYSPSATVGSMMGIKPETFITSVILDGVDQVFEEVLYVENFKADDLQGSFLVNGLNLQTDVMRYDVPNTVTGKKTIGTVKVDLLKMQRNYKVQDVDLLLWIQTSVLKSGNCKANGRTTFRNSTVFTNGISLEGLLNKNHFTAKNVLLKSYPQNIVAKKTFVNEQQGMSLFKSIKLKGLLNNINIAEIIRNQVYQNDDVTFETQVDFAADLTANNVHFNGLYQGINVSQLLSNLSNYVTLNNYYNNYAQLYEIALKVRNSLKVQAHYLNYYRKIQEFDNAESVFAINGFYEGVDLVVLSRSSNGSQVVNFFRWQPEAGLFLINNDLFEISFPQHIMKLAPVQFDSEALLYLEYEEDGLPEGNKRMGNIFSLVNKTAIEIIAHIANNGTKSIIPFSIIPTDKSCVLLLYYNADFMQIYCEEKDDLILHQRLNVPKPVNVEMVLIDNFWYVMALSEQTQNREACVTIWKIDPDTEIFNELQHIHVVNPMSISSVTHNGAHYLAINSGHLQNTLHPGQVDIKKFDMVTKRFVEWQEFSVSAPKQVAFSVLPSNELVLYVVCDTPTEPLLVFKYKGISKFVLQTVATSLTVSDSMVRFNGFGNHFVITKAGGRYTVIQAIFKGKVF